MRTLVITDQDIVGFHQWTNAPTEVYFLRNKHRHIFRVRCAFSVEHDDRDVEIFMLEDRIARYFHKRWSTPCHFFEMSCEMIAKDVLNEFGCVWVEVLEDGRGGGRVER